MSPSGTITSIVYKGLAIQVGIWDKGLRVQNLWKLRVQEIQPSCVEALATTGKVIDQAKMMAAMMKILMLCVKPRSHGLTKVTAVI